LMLGSPGEAGVESAKEILAEAEKFTCRPESG
jgi:hypothetical protein